MTQHFVLCAWGSLKRSLCLGRYFSRYMSCLLLMAPRRFLQRQGMGLGSGGPRAGPPALPPRARGPRVWWGRSGWVLTATRALPTPRPLPELLPPPGSPVLVTCCQPCWPSVHPTTASSRLAPRSPCTRGPMLPQPPCLPGAPRHAEATGKAWAYMLSGGDLGQQAGGYPGLPAKRFWRSPVPTRPRPRAMDLLWPMRCEPRDTCVRQAKLREPPCDSAVTFWQSRR